MEHPTFSRLYEHSPLSEVTNYLETLAQSDYAYHLDDHPRDVIWSKRHKKSVIEILEHNAAILWRMHISGRQKWNDTWEIYAPSVNVRMMKHS